MPHEDDNLDAMRQTMAQWYAATMPDNTPRPFDGAYRERAEVVMPDPDIPRFVGDMNPEAFSPIQPLQHRIVRERYNGRLQHWQPEAEYLEDLRIRLERERSRLGTFWHVDDTHSYRPNRIRPRIEPDQPAALRTLFTPNTTPDNLTSIWVYYDESEIPVVCTG